MKNMKIKKALVKRVIAAMLTVSMVLTFTMSNMFPVNTAEAVIVDSPIFDCVFPSGTARWGYNNYARLVQPENYSDKFCFPDLSKKVFNAFKNGQTYVKFSRPIENFTEKDRRMLFYMVYMDCNIYAGRGTDINSLTIGYSGGKAVQMAWTYRNSTNGTFGMAPREIRERAQYYIVNNGMNGINSDSRYRINGTDSTLTKLKKIYSYTCGVIDHVGNFAASQGALDNYELCDVITRRSGCCMDFANIFEILCSYYGIKCQIIVSDYANTIVNGDDYIHAFNMVEFDNKWYIVDCTKGAAGTMGSDGMYDYSAFLNSIDTSLDIGSHPCSDVVRNWHWQDWWFQPTDTEHLYPSIMYCTVPEPPIGTWVFVDTRYTGGYIPNMNDRYSLARECEENKDLVQHYSNQLAVASDEARLRAYWGVN